MENNSLQKLKIFLWLAVRNNAQTFGSESAESISPETIFPAITSQLSEREVKEFERLKQAYEEKSAEEKQNWQVEVAQSIGTDEILIDKNIHWSHLDAGLQKEIPSIRKIIISALPASDQKRFSPNHQEIEAGTARNRLGLETIIRKTFSRQFVSQSDLASVNAFDRLSGEQFARLARLAGIHEVALACVRITAVESVAAFLRRFPAEDARAIATQLSHLPQISDERLLFAENLVHIAFETESQPSAMLDLLGIWLVGILLCNETVNRINYTAQKLPLEVSPKLSGIIETQCRQTPPLLQKEISAEIEQLAKAIK